MTRTAVIMFAIVWRLAAAAPPQDPEKAAFVELAVDRPTHFIGEPIEIELRVGFDPAFFRANVIQTTRQQLDIPVQVEAAALIDAPSGVVISDAPASRPGPRTSLVVNGARVEAERVEDRAVAGRPFTVVRIAKRLVARKPGSHALPAPVLRFAYATRFDEDLVGGRVPVDRREAVVRGRSLDLAILDLPETGRPDGFGGAVGQFTARAEIDKTEVEAGESVKLALVIEGTGDLAGFEAPRLELPGFHVYGKIDSKGPARRIVYDVAAIDDRVRAVPPIPFAYFDPAPPAQYRVASTASIPITVKPRSPARSRPAAAVDAPAGPVPGVNDVFGLKTAGAARAERAYFAGRLDEALGLFQAAFAEPGSDAGTILYDVGNCLFRLGRPAEALLAYRRAGLRLPRDEQVRFNEGLTERRLGVEPPRSDSFADAIEGALGSFTRGEVLAAGATLVLASVAGWILLRRRAVRVACVLLVLLVLLGLALAGRGAGIPWLAGTPRGIVLGSEIVLRDEPHAEGAVLARLRAGEPVRVSESSDRWARVTHARGAGWTERAGIGVID